MTEPSARPHIPTLTVGQITHCRYMLLIMRIRTLFIGLLLSVTVVVPAQALPAGAAGVPTVTAISTTSGSTAGGTVITVTGTNFVGVTGVNFGAGTNAAAGTKITVASTSKLTVTSPAHAAGRLNLRVITAAGTSAIVDADVFTYVEPPTLLKISPNYGMIEGGNTVALVGNYLTGAKVTVDNVAVAVTVPAGTTTPTIQMPPHAAGYVSIKVTTAGGSVSIRYDYYTQPVITAMTPASGPTTGAGVQVEGTGLESMYRVTIGGEDFSTPYYYTVGRPGVGLRLPAHAAGTYDLQITTLGGVTENTAITKFTFVEPATK